MSLTQPPPQTSFYIVKNVINFKKNDGEYFAKSPRQKIFVDTILRGEGVRQLARRYFRISAFSLEELNYFQFYGGISNIFSSSFCSSYQVESISNLAVDKRSYRW